MVPVVDLSRRGTRMASVFGTTAAGIAASGTYLLGPQTTAFEVELGHWLEADDPAHVTAVASGGSALQLALTAIGVGPGDEVIVPAFTAVPTASAVWAIGARPVLVDVEQATANLDPALAAEAVTDRTRAIVVVHLYGRPAGLPVTELPIIEDAAQAMGALHPHSGSAATAYSFYPTKNLGGIGDGGAVVTHDPNIAAAVRRLRVHGMTEMYVHTERSQNFRMSEIEAAWLRSELATLSDDNERRRAIAGHYRDVAPHLAWQDAHPDHVHHLCVFRSTERDVTRRWLAEHDVATAIHYPLAVTDQPAYRHFATRDCPIARAWAQECVTVPCFPELTDAEIEQVGAALSALRTEVQS